MKKAVSGLIVTILLLGLIVGFRDIRPAEALAGIIRIKADGSIDPPSATIHRDGDIYTLTGNITSGIVIERSDIIIDGSGFTICGNSSESGVDLFNIQNTTIKKMNIRNFSCGIRLYQAFHNAVLENNVTENGGGLMAFASDNNTVSGNCFINNAAFYAIDIEYSAYNTIIGNSIKNTTWTGIELYGSNDNFISGNSITQNSDGILLFSACSNKVFGNTASYNRFNGIGLYYSSNNNTISANTIANNNDRGLRIAESDSNLIYHNNLVNNANQTYSDDSTNVWDDGYPSGGNYWSDHSPSDNYSGRCQNETGSDGIGDTSYAIDADNLDRYPLMLSYGSLPFELLEGDVNYDGIVDILDLVKIAIAFGSDPSSQAWNPDCDLNRDESVDILDLAIVASHFGEVARLREYLFMTKCHVWYNVTGY